MEKSECEAGLASIHADIELFWDRVEIYLQRPLDLSTIPSDLRNAIEEVALDYSE